MKLALRSSRRFADDIDMHTLGILAAALTIEILFALLVGRFLHHCSQLADVAESMPTSFGQAGLTPTASGCSRHP